jgi:hypothetical protein
MTRTANTTTHWSGKKTIREIQNRYDGWRKVDDGAALTMHHGTNHPATVGRAMAELASAGSVNVTELRHHQTRKEFTDPIDHRALDLRSALDRRASLFPDCGSFKVRSGKEGMNVIEIPKVFAGVS